MNAMLEPKMAATSTQASFVNGTSPAGPLAAAVEGMIENLEGN